MKKTMKRVFLLLLCVLMVLPMVAPASVSAATSVTYGIGVLQTGTGYSTQSIDDAIAQTKTYYANGTNNWCVQEYVHGITSGGKFYSKTGTKVLAAVGDYIVYKIKSPGSGVRSLTLNHGTFFRSGKVDMYVIPATTTDVAASLVPDNRVGRIDFYNENTNASTDVKWNNNTVVGSYNFGSHAEYYVVFKACEASPISPAISYFYPSSLTITQGVLTPTESSQRTNSIIVSDSPIETFEPATYAATGEINGEPHIYIPIEGKRVFVYNLETGEKYDEIKTRFTVCRGITCDPEGRVWMVGSQYYLQCYDPATRTIKEYSTQGKMDSGFDLIYAENGCLYFGSSMNAVVYEFNIATETLRNFANLNADTAYACGLAYKDGYVYAGLTGNKNSDEIHTREIVKIRVSDGVVVDRTDVSDCVDRKAIMIRGAGITNGIYMAGGIEVNKMLAVDIETMEQVEIKYNDVVITNGINFSPTEMLDGKRYFSVRPGTWDYNPSTGAGTKGSVEPGLYRIDDNTGEVEFVSGNVRNSLKYTQDSIININGKNCIFWDGGGNRYYMDLETKQVTNISNMVSNTDGAPVTIDSVAVGAPGKNQIFIGAFNNDKCSVFDTQSGTISGNFYSNGQTDCMLWYNGYLYAGNYKSGILTQVAQDEWGLNGGSAKNKVVIDFRYALDPNGEPFSQVRVHALAAGDGKVFAGTMPDSYLRGGCIGWYDTVTGETYVERNVVQNQSINALVYHDGYLYGTTTVAGGTGSGTDESLSAKMFIYDVANKRKVAEYDLHDYISGLPTRLSYMGGIAADPNIATNGKVWGVVAETLFSFTFNKKTGAITVKEEMVLSKTQYTGAGSKGLDICFLDGYIYAYFKASRLFLKMDYNDPTQYTPLPVSGPSHYVIGEDKNLYYSNDDTLYMYPLNVTDADKTAASAVDAAIAALPKPATLADKLAVENVRAAYDALFWDQRALMQRAYLLEEAEVDILEARIATINPQKPDQHLVNELMNIYQGMSSQQRSYVSNYAILEAAQNLLSSDVFAIGTQVFNTFEAAMAAAQRGDVIKLLANHEADNLVLDKDTVLDLNGNCLVCDTVDTAALGFGNIIDSSAGAGLLLTKELTIKQNNTYLPLWDNLENGYRFFAYTFTVDSNPEKIAAGTQKFWYKMEFASDMAYEMISAGHTNLQIGVDLAWNGKHLVRAMFGRGEPLSTHTFSSQWADMMRSNPDTWIYAVVSGLSDFALDGTLTVTPLVISNGCQAQVAAGNGVITYEINHFDYGWTERN